MMNKNKRIMMNTLFLPLFLTLCKSLSPPPLKHPPAFAWTTLGHMTFAHVTKTTHFNATDILLLKRYPIVQFDKGQNTQSMPNSSQEDRFISAARQIKAANPNAVTLMYLNGLIDFTAFTRLSDPVTADPSLMLRNSKGDLVHTLPPLVTFDHRNPKMRKLFVADAEYGVQSGAFDGVFVDRANYASRALLEVREGKMHPDDVHGWDEPTAASMVPAQTKLFAELTAALGPTRVVLAKETGGGAPFTDWAVANAAMTTDTFCSSYEPNQGRIPGPESKCGGDSWSYPACGHTPRTPIIAKVNVSNYAKCQQACCEDRRCKSVLFNTQAKFCVLFSQTYNSNFVCMNGHNGTHEAVEWLANKAAPGEGAACPVLHPRWNQTTWNASQCEQDMLTVTQAAARGQLTESHGQGPIDSDTPLPEQTAAREFTIAAFLVAAGNFSYFSYAGWAHGQAWSLSGTRWWSEYDRPLGQPLDPPMTLAGPVGSMKYRRRFSSGTTVTVDLKAHTGSIQWSGL